MEAQDYQVPFLALLCFTLAAAEVAHLVAEQQVLEVLAAVVLLVQRVAITLVYQAQQTQAVGVVAAHIKTHTLLMAVQEVLELSLFVI
jgi:hypothetical protein